MMIDKIQNAMTWTLLGWFTAGAITFGGLLFNVPLTTWVFAKLSPLWRLAAWFTILIAALTSVVSGVVERKPVFTVLGVTLLGLKLITGKQRTT